MTVKMDFCNSVSSREKVLVCGLW